MENHIAVLYNDTILVHGGGDRYGKTVSSTCYIAELVLHYNLEPYEPVWRIYNFYNSPRLSYHAAFSINNVVYLVGGFDGKQRTSDVYCLHSNGFKHISSIGSVPLTGRSAHLALPISEQSFIVIGRETCQRRWTEMNEVTIIQSAGELKARWSKPTTYPVSVSNYCAAIDGKGNYLIFGGRKTSEIEFYNTQTCSIQGHEISRNVKGRSGAACGYWKDFLVVIGGLEGTVDNCTSILLIKSPFSAGASVYESDLRLPIAVHSSAYFYRYNVVFMIGGCYGDTSRGKLAIASKRIIQVDLEYVVNAKMNKIKL